MELLDPNDFHLVTEVLHKIDFNNLFARAVIEQNFGGKVYVDNKNHPTTFYIVHPYTMSLLLGNADNTAFNLAFKEHALNTAHNRSHPEWMQAFPNTWDKVLPELFGKDLIKSEDNTDKQESGMVELNTRLNFKFNREKFLRSCKQVNDPDIKIVRTSREVFKNMTGGVIPLHFWKNEDDFIDNGIAYTLFYQDQPASTAFSAFRFGDLLELGIETGAGFRGKGFAEMVCSAIIHDCIQRELEPVWACRKENPASHKLALKLGFEVSATLPYYRLSK